LIPSYVINLVDRPDRLIAFHHDSNAPTASLEIIEAVDGKVLKECHPSPDPVAACWLSHQKVYRTFLDSRALFALILEDDAVFSEQAINLVSSITEKELDGIDIFQIGYLVHNDRVASGLKDSKARRNTIFLNRLCGRFPSWVARRFFNNTLDLLVLQRKLRLLEPIFKDRFETGTHAFIISRKFAEIAIQFNNPVLLPADVAVAEIARVSCLNAFRTSRSLVSQSDLISSIPDIAFDQLEFQIRDLMNTKIE